MPNVQVEHRASRRARRRTTWLAGVALATTALLVPTAGATGRNGSAATVDPPPQPAGPIATWGQKADVEGPNGLYVGGPNGYIYAASVAADEIDVVDPQSGEVLDRIG